MTRRRALWTLARQPHLAVLYLLVYWGKTTFGLLMVAANALWFAGGTTRWSVAVGAAAIVVAGFNLGFELGNVMKGPPPGRCR